MILRCPFSFRMTLGGLQNMQAAAEGLLKLPRRAANKPLLFTQFLAEAPLLLTLIVYYTASGSSILAIDSLWKPSTITVGTGIQAAASDANGTLELNLTGTESRSQMKPIDG